MCLRTLDGKNVVHSTDCIALDGLVTSLNFVNREKCKAFKVIIVIPLCKIPSFIIVDVYHIPRWELYHVWYKKLHCLLIFLGGAQSNSA
jgi:hypothetical protein